MRFFALAVFLILMGVEGKADEVLNLFQKRYSAREFDCSKKVSKEQIEICLEAARLSPSCYNEQPWRFIICEKARSEDSFNKAIATLVPFNQQWAKEADALIIVCTSMAFSKDLKPNRWGYYDTGAASMAFCLQASQLGLMTHQMGGFDEVKVSKEFKIPDGFSAISIIAIGYEKKESALKAMKLKERKPFNDLFYFGQWKNP